MNKGLRHQLLRRLLRLLDLLHRDRHPKQLHPAGRLRIGARSVCCDRKWSLHPAQANLAIGVAEGLLVLVVVQPEVDLRSRKERGARKGTVFA